MKLKLKSMLPAIIIFIGTIMVAGGTFWLTRKNMQKNSELHAKTDLLQNNLTGGDNYPEVTAGVHLGTDNISFEVQNKSMFTIYDLKINYNDLNKLDEILKKKKLEDLNDDDFNYYNINEDIGNLSSNRFKRLITYEMPGEGKKSFIFRMSARNGEYEQLFDLSRNENKELVIHGYLRKHNPTSVKQEKNIKEY